MGFFSVAFRIVDVCLFVCLCEFCLCVYVLLAASVAAICWLVMRKREDRRKE